MNADQFVIDLLLRVSVLFLVLLVLDWVLARQRKPLVRSAVWHAGLIGLLIVPLLGFLISPTFQWNEPAVSILGVPDSLSKFARTKLSSTHEAAESQVTNRRNTEETQPSPTAQFKEDTTTEESADVASSLTTNWIGVFSFAKTLICFGLVVGYLISLIRFINSLVHTARIYRDSKPVGEGPLRQQFETIRSSFGIGATLTLASSEEIDVPMVIGTFRPRVLIPTPMMLDDDLECILMHELTHVRRADPIWNLILKIISLFYWFHPLMYVSRRRVTDVREQICDNYCVHTIGRLAYGSALIDVAKRLVNSSRPNTPLELAAIRKSSLEQRIEFIRDTEGDSRYLASPRSRFTWLTISVLAALLVSTFTAFQVKAVAFQNSLQNASDSDDADMWNFTAEQKKVFAELLQKGDDEIESIAEKVAILTLIRDKNKENFDRIKSWSGNYKKVFDDLREDGTHRSVLEGRFVTAPQLDSIMSDGNKGKVSIIGIDKTERLQKNRRPVFGKWISTPEHLLSRHLYNRQTFIHRSSRVRENSRGVLWLDTRDWLGQEGWKTADFLSLDLEHASHQGFWDRASLSKTKTDSGLVYTLKKVYGFNRMEGTNKETLSMFSYSFSESAGYSLSSRSTEHATWQNTVRFEHEQQNGIYLPFKYRAQFANGDVANHEMTIELTHTEVNKELPKDAFDIAQLEPSENDVFLDDLNGKTMRYQSGQFQEVDKDSIKMNGSFVKQWPSESLDWKTAQSVKTYKFQLFADRNGGLKEIVGSGGYRMSDDGKPEANFETAEKLVTKLKWTAQMMGTGIAQHFHFTLIPDASLNQVEVENVKKELAFEMMFADGTMKTLPTIEVSQKEQVK